MLPVCVAVLSAVPGTLGHLMATTRDRLDDLFQRCADLGIDVEWRDLGELRRGEFRRHANVIVLNRRLTTPQALSCLAHELGHAFLGHGCSTPANEQRAWEYAAALVISPAEYAAAEARVGSEAPALALELAVTPRLIEGWRRWWVTRGRSSTHVENPQPTPSLV